MQGRTTRDWREVPDDPDLAMDFGYEAVELDLIPTMAEGTNRVLVLPTDEEMLADDAFMIVDERSVRDLATVR